MKRENFYRRDPSAALQGMSSMSLEERGVYNTVLDLLYLTWRPLEDDPGYIAGHCRCAVQKLNPILKRLIEAEKLVRFVEGGRSYISNPAFERERNSVKGPSKSRSGRAGVEEKSEEVGEKSAGVGENLPLLGCDVEEIQHDAPLEKSRVEESRQETPNPLEGGEGLEGFAEGWEAYPIEGRSTAGPERAEGVWAAACHRAGGHARLIEAIRAYAASAYSGRHKAFHRWLADNGFVAHLPKVSARINGAAWSGPDDVRQAFIGFRDERWVASYIDSSGWRDLPERALIAPNTIALGQIEATLRAMRANRPAALVGLTVVLKAKAA